MRLETLKDAYLFGIQDMNNGCQKAMDAMKDAATHPDLKQMMEGAIGSMHHALGRPPEDGQITNEDAFALMALENDLLSADDLPKAA